MTTKQSHPSTIDVNAVSILENPWDNVYWFARMFIDSDRYGGIGKSSQTMLTLVSGLQAILRQQGESEQAIVGASMNFIEEILLKHRRETKQKTRVEALFHDLKKRVNSRRDVEVICFTIEHVVVPTNESLKNIPNDDREFAESVVNAWLKTKGEAGLREVINIWDDLGLHGCLAAERTEIVKRFGALHSYLSKLVKREDLDIILTAFCQEYERRVAQKRKGRAGRGVESAATCILNFYDIKTSRGPEHFTAALEIDRWVRTSDRWYIGISCKRTLRERWKQAYTTDLGLLDRHKIKYIWYLITYDRDLSDDKITEMGSHRVVFYLPDDSERFVTASQHPGMKDYVKPMTSFVKDLRKEL